MEALVGFQVLQRVGRRIYVRDGGLGGLSDDTFIDLPDIAHGEEPEDLTP
jgi:hypothetical protein